MKYSEIISTIKSKLESVDHIKQVVSHPLMQSESLTSYPAVIFVPDTSDSSFSDTGSNHRILNFKIWVVVAGTQLQVGELFDEVLPNAVDAVFAELDAGYDFGTIDGHRVWARLGSGAWTLSQEEKSITATAELNLVVRLDVDIG